MAITENILLGLFLNMCRLGEYINFFPLNCKANFSFLLIGLVSFDREICLIMNSMRHIILTKFSFLRTRELSSISGGECI